MLRRVSGILIIAAILLVAGAPIASAGSNVGGGVHFLRNLGDIKEQGFDQNSFSIMASYQITAVLLKFEADVEYIFDFAGTGEAMWQPQAWVLAGGPIYGGLGIGIGHSNGEWQDEPFYALRAGVELPLAAMSLDMFASYRFQQDETFEDVTGEDLDSITFAAILRFGLGL